MTMRTIYLRGRQPRPRSSPQFAQTSQAIWPVSKLFHSDCKWHDAWVFVHVWRRAQENSKWQSGGKHHRLPNPYLPAENANVACAQDANPNGMTTFGDRGLSQETPSSSQSTREMPPSKLPVHPNISKIRRDKAPQEVSIKDFPFLQC